MDYHVFISHSSKDKQYAKSLGKDLEGQGFRVWFDSNEIEPSEDWVTEIERGIDSSAVIVVIWTENATKSEWVNREIARADQKNKPVIPLKFDNAETPIILQRTQHIDFSNGYYNAFSQLTSYLMRYVDSEQQTKTIENVASWSYQKRPFFRNRFLEENNYINRQDINFARNKRTDTLVNSRTQTKSEVFVTITVVPISDELDVELETLNRLIPQNSWVLRTDQAALPWQRIDLSNYRNLTSTQSEYIYSYLYQDPQIKGVTNYFRFDENGSIEYGDGNIYFFEGQKGYRGYVFDLITVLGITWKTLSLATIVYNQFSYDKQIQLLINLFNTNNTTIGGFASDMSRKEWPSLISNHNYRALYSAFNENGLGICKDINIQLIYNLNLSTLTKNIEISQDLIVDLSNRLQRGFNYPTKERHYIPETQDFPWHQFELYNHI